ncbi:unnamed protein product [Prunus brigantina]
MQVESAAFFYFILLQSEFGACLLGDRIMLCSAFFFKEVWQSRGSVLVLHQGAKVRERARQPERESAAIFFLPFLFVPCLSDQ